MGICVAVLQNFYKAYANICHIGLALYLLLNSRRKMVIKCFLSCSKISYMATHV